MGKWRINQADIRRGIERGTSDRVLFQELSLGVEEVIKIEGGISEKGRRTWQELADEIRARRGVAE